MILRNKSVLIVMAAVLLLSFSACSVKKTGSEDGLNFPKDSQGYPKRNVILVNGKKVELSDQKSSVTDAKIREDGTVMISLPQGLPINNWYIEENENIKLVSYTTNTSLDKTEGDREGQSAEIQTFIFRTTKIEPVLFKWVNVEQSGKSFEEKEEEYLLKVVVSD